MKKLITLISGISLMIVLTGFVLTPANVNAQVCQGLTGQQLSECLGRAAQASGGSGGSSSGPNFSINCSLTNLNSIVTCVSGVMQASVWLLMTAAFVYTIYGAVRFIGAEGKDREKWRSVMVYGIIGLFVITSIWGLVSILDVTFGLGKTPIQPPQFVAP